MDYLTTKELPVSEQPYEKCERYGPQILSDAELLAIIIKTGTKNQRSVELAQNILKNTTNKGIIGLNQLTLKELMKVKGIGKVKAIQIQAVVELSRRMSKAINETGLSLLTPGSIAKYYMEDMRHCDTEQIKLLMLNSKNKLIKDMIISIGTINASLISPREIFINALKHSAVFVILLHNHPSGDPAPSSEDICVTKRVLEAGALIGITLLDHIVIGDNKYVSLREMGIL